MGSDRLFFYCFFTHIDCYATPAVCITDFSFTANRVLNCTSSVLTNVYSCSVGQAE